MSRHPVDVGLLRKVVGMSGIIATIKDTKAHQHSISATSQGVTDLDILNFYVNTISPVEDRTPTVEGPWYSRGRVSDAIHKVVASCNSLQTLVWKDAVNLSTKITHDLADPGQDVASNAVIHGDTGHEEADVETV